MTIPYWPWKPKPDYSRLLNALNRKGDPDFVPFLELFADTEVITAVLGEPIGYVNNQKTERDIMQRELEQKIRFWYQLGFDAFWEGPVLDLPDILTLSSEDIASLPRQERRWVNEAQGVITNWKEFEHYPWPKASDADFFPMGFVSTNLPEGMAIIGMISGVLEPVMWLMGYETLAFSLYDQPDLVQAMFNKIEEIFLPVAETIVQMDDVIALWMGDDMGFKTQTMISSQHLRQYVFPIQKKFADVAHNAGIPFLLHSCGQLDAVMDDLIDDVGIDAKHSFEDVIEPVESISARYGDRIAIIGGVDMDLLTRGTEEQVRARTREILYACAPGKSYILGSGNSIANYIPPENFLAMLDEGWRFNSESNR
jgi:uroporphyrinogen decarboxylase